MTPTRTEIINIILGQAIISLRRRTNKTQAQFGALTGISQNMQSRYEKGKTPIPAAYLFEVAIATNTPMLDIVPADIGFKVNMLENNTGLISLIA